MLIYWRLSSKCGWLFSSMACNKKSPGWSQRRVSWDWCTPRSRSRTWLPQNSHRPCHFGGLRRWGWKMKFYPKFGQQAIDKAPRTISASFTWQNSCRDKWWFDCAAWQLCLGLILGIFQNRAHVELEQPHICASRACERSGKRTRVRFSI